VGQLPQIVQEQLAKSLPVKVSPGAQYFVNVRPGCLYATLINNNGVTKAPKGKPVIDATQAVAVTVSWQRELRVKSVNDIKNQRPVYWRHDGEATITIPAGEVAILELILN
jgi:hypothetical protein